MAVQQSTETDNVSVIQKPQIDKQPSYQRDSFLRPPDWRYLEARDYLREEQAGRKGLPPKDAVVQFLIRLLRGLSNPSTRSVIQLKWRDAADIIHIGTAARESSFSQELENHIINGLSAKEAEQRMGCAWFTASHYNMFRDFFFDLSGICAITAWVNHHLFNPAIRNKQGDLLRNRLLAYCEGSDAATAALSPLYDSSHSDLLNLFARNARQKKIFDYLVQSTRLAPEIYAGMMETAYKDITTREFQERIKDKETAGESSLQELARDLSEGVRRFTLDEQQDYDQFGLAYANNYTSIILDKGNDNGKENKPQ